MDVESLSTWYADYVERFAAVGRGDREVAWVADCYTIPLLATTDDLVAALTTPEQVLELVESQVAGMRAEGYARTEVVSTEQRIVSLTTAVLEASFVRIRFDGSVIGQHTATYVVIGSDGAIRIAALCLHSPAAS